MRKILIIIFLLNVNTFLFAGINGQVREINGKKVLTIWGTHYERGYAHGFLMGTEIKDVFQDYVVNYLCYNVSLIYNSFRNFFVQNYAIEGRYRIEAEAMIQGMMDSGMDVYNQILGRNIDATDLLLCSAMPDLGQAFSGTRSVELGCSSMSSWGSSTKQDACLSGHIIITRLMDWSAHPALARNHLLIVHDPSEIDEQKWISFGFSGFMGALSGINEYGVAAFMNVGNHGDFQEGDPCYPVLLTIRNGIESKDYNQDMVNNPDDIIAAVQERNRSGAAIIHVVKEDGLNILPLIIECNCTKGVSIRNVSNNTMIPGDHLVATNHFRTLYEPVWCNRYLGISDSLQKNPAISAARSWTILKDAAGGSGNVHAIQYIPFSGSIKWATMTVSLAPACTQYPTEFSIDSLFYYSTGIQETNITNAYPDFHLIRNYPNPFNEASVIEFSLSRSEHVILIIYDSIGRQVTTLASETLAQGMHHYEWIAGGLSSGIYFCRLETESFDLVKKLVLLR